ncbi:MAG: efflux RND transporter periplasmic adaptor subunit [Acidobacteria bacterium]|jgi:HlyD family secretion protein|nr:efflux RND transporter periplasmic adaptor subunit [Acidobacteriota bacterium]
MKIKKILLGVGLALLVTLALFFLLTGKEDKNGGLKFVEVKKGDIFEKALAVGTIEPEKEIKVKSTIPGIVEEVYFKVGDPIEKDKPLFKISPNPTPLEYVEARRNMEVAQILMEKIRSERDRKVKMYKERLVSDSDMEETESRFNEISLRYKITQERFELLEKGRIQMVNRSVDSIVKSPMSGIVLQQSAFEGDAVVPLTNFQPGTEMCSMADMSLLRFKGKVDEIDVGKLLPGMVADIQVGALLDAKVTGRLERIYPKAEKEGNATMFGLEISIVDAGAITLRAGYSATAYVKVKDKKGILVIPERLITFENDKRYVETMGDGKITKKEVQVGLSDGLNIEIVSGLKAGEQVVERPPREIE